MTKKLIAIIPEVVAQFQRLNMAGGGGMFDVGFLIVDLGGEPSRVRYADRL